MKEEKQRKNTRERKRRQRKRHCIEKELQSQRESYAKDPKERMKKKVANSKYYQENGKELRKEFRDKAREAKKESTANHLKYEEAIKYGPIFICVKDRPGQSNYYICHNCFKIMKSDKKVPSLSVEMSYIWKSYPLNYN